ncbi:hypothetical protein SAMN05880501_11691 [Ureibacillus xyleni]|uniref:Uncharacterized protein n=1 Tax=Ureibacillus xyleni TaxID=614648 RepID=A0A285TND2_9BACL|nr:Wadjet anti-phage system protein JetA family protein [Ureibacillus xyleni]SOC24091.1 hypothetical protein SAMN05880501_11691 [Ureibacillus xyleni]
MDTYKLFMHIPENFFSILSGKLKELHTDLLFLIYEQYKKSIFVIDRDVIVDLFIEYFETHDMEYADEEDNNLRDAKERAFHYISKFNHHGWITQEHYLDYSVKISIPDYSIKMLETFHKISTGYQMEFSGHVLSIYQNLMGEEGQTYVAIHQAYQTTKELTDGLKGLNHNIKKYTEKLLDVDDIKEILKQIFDEYELKVLGSHYYRLKSSDHISKYRTKIIKKVRDFSFNHVLVAEQARLMAKDKFSPDISTAESEIFEWLDAIERSFGMMDEILGEIDSRNQKYHRVATQRVKMKVGQTQNFSSKINKILLYLSEQIKENGDRKLIDEEFSSQIQLFKQESLEESSYKYPSQARPKINPTAVQMPIINTDIKQKKMDKFKERLKEEKTIKDINSYVNKVMQDKRELTLSEFPMDNKEEWVNLIYSILYSKSKKANYSLSKPDKLNRVTETEQGIVPNQKIIRK